VPVETAEDEIAVGLIADSVAEHQATMEGESRRLEQGALAGAIVSADDQEGP
jgi:hypothetical protein